MQLAIQYIHVLPGCRQYIIAEVKRVAMAERLGTIPLLEEEITEVLESDANFKGSLNIFVVGKLGSGKSSLCKDLLGSGPNDVDVPTVASGVVPITKHTKVYEYPDDNCSVTVTDTRGLFDWQEDGYVQKTAHKLREVFQSNRKRNGVVLFCIEMFGGRIDEACLASLAMLHKICGKEIWRYTVIALTKADFFQTEDWDPKVLEEMFDEKLCEAQDYLRLCFTACTSTAKSGCYIGMTEEEYDTLNIPILPTSVLRDERMKAMKKVGYGCWFDTLLQELCTRKKGMILVKVHPRRLLNLGHIDEFFELDRTKEYFRTNFCFPETMRKCIKWVVGKSVISIVWKEFFSTYSLKVAIEAPRFQKAPAEEQVEEDDSADDDEPSAPKKEKRCACL